MSTPARWGVYLHIPWCRHRCPYCAFVVEVRAAPPHRAYTDALARAWAREALHFAGLGPPDTVYFGGGTPSEAPPEEIARILAFLAPAPGAEVTLEANPGGLGSPPEARARLAALREAGVTRLSLGVQSFVPHVAKALGRAHDSRDALVLVEQAQAAGFASVSFDLLFGAPGQTLPDFGEDLRRTLALGADHVSLYGLTILEGTAFERRGVAPPDDDLWRAMFDLAAETLPDGGLERYEVANYARPGHRGRHNEHYWRARPWAGLGVGAHGWRPDGARTVVGPSLDAFLADPAPTAEHPSPRELAAELTGSTLRHVDGLDRALLRRWTGLDVAPPPHLAGLLAATADHVRLLPDGFPVADALAARLCATLQPSAGARAAPADSPGSPAATGQKGA